MKNNTKKIFLFFALFINFLIANGQTRVLEVPFITQQPHGSWCWAASCAMVSSYYGNNPSMCGIVEWARLNLDIYRGTSNCCNSPTPSLCEYGCHISDIPLVLTSEGLSCTEEGVLSLTSVKNVIDNNRPMIIQGFSGNGAHTMVLVGYSNSDLHYIDPWDGYHINSYIDATTTECLGAFHYKWTSYTHVLTTPVCPPNLSIHNTIGANANIHAQLSLTIDGLINNNSTVLLNSGNNVLFNQGFEIQTGSTLVANVSSSPCQ